MAKDDMNLIVYKILRYLYDCNRKGKTPTFSDLFNVLEHSTIPQCYLASVLIELVESGYIVGCDVLITKDVTHFALQSDARITLKGVNFLDDNSKMKKAAKVTGTSFEIVLSSVIAVAMPL